MRVLDARGEDLLERPHRSLTELETYAEHTASSLLYLTLEVGVYDIMFVLLVSVLL